MKMQQTFRHGQLGHLYASLRAAWVDVERMPLVEHRGIAMLSRRLFLKSSAAVASCLASSLTVARSANAPGVSDTEIKFGQTMPYSGPASAYGVNGRTEVAYFKMMNEMGGINGRKLNLISLDDSLSPSKTVEQTRRLIEQEEVAFVFGSPGTASNSAIRPYLNDNKVPQLFVASGDSMFGDPQHYPWTIGFYPNYRSEARNYAKHILRTKPDAKIAVLYQKVAFDDYPVGLREGLGLDHAQMIFAEVSYQVSQPTIDSEVVALQASGADTLIIAATPKFAAQAIRKVYDIGWNPLRYLGYPSASIATVLKPAGLDKAKGLISASFAKDPTDARWKDDAGYKEWVTFVAKYLTPADLIDSNAVDSFGAAATLIQVLKQCGDDLSRENIMRQAANLKDLELPMLLPGIKINTSPDNFYPLRQMQLATFNGGSWELFGDLISG
jgi:branched-chain amino acid transport system substrate-binding protein